MTWTVELSRSAIEVLRALPREEQERIAQRIGHLEDGGLPPGLADEDVEGVAVPAGDCVLVCVAEVEARRIVVVTLHPTRAPAPRALRSLLTRWIRTMMGGGSMEAVLQDFRYALRSLRKNPAFSALAVLTLGLGIGAATAIYSVADGVLIEPLPYDDPDDVVTVWASWDNFPDKTWLSVPEFQLIHQETRTFEDVALYGLTAANFTSVDNPERVGAAQVTPNVFSVLGVEPVVGRIPTWEEARDSAPPVLLAWEAWQRRWGGDPAVVGSTVEIDGSRVPVLAVLPPGFVLPADYASPSSAEIFFPTWVDLEAPAPDLGTGGDHGAYGVARLVDGRTVEEAQADVDRIWAQMVTPQGLYDPERRFAIRVFGAKSDIVGEAGGMIGLLLGAVALVLLVACGNVANLLLSRAEGRTGEVAVRAALGAGRGRILRQLLTESGILAVLGGALGMVLADVGVRTLLAIDPDSVPRSASISLDGSVLLFALATSLATAVIFGLVPALRMIRGGDARSLHESGRGTGAASNRMQGLLVASQMAMAVILLAGAGLTVRTFASLLAVDPGFGAERVLTFRVTAPAGSYPDTESVVGFYQELERRLEGIPGVRRVGAARLLPLASTMGDAGFFVEGYVAGPNESTQAEWQFATPGYLEVMNIPLLAGRTLEERDIEGNREVIVINESAARHYWGTGDPIGSVVTVFNEPAVVVGVVGDVAHNELTGSVRERFYRPHAQIDGIAQRSMTLTLATETDPRGFVEPARRVLRELNPSIPMAQVRTLDDVMAGAVAQPRFAMVLLGAFAAIALTLAVVGIYGVIAYAVSRRTREIGLRMALGAESRQVVGLVVRKGMAMALLGVLVGTGIALTLTDLMQGMLYGVAPRDLATFVLVPSIFVVVALVACWVPAARASRVDPATALRYE